MLQSAAKAQQRIAQLETDLAAAQHTQHDAEANAQQLTLDLTQTAEDLRVLQHDQKCQVCSCS